MSFNRCLANAKSSCELKGIKLLFGQCAFHTWTFDIVLYVGQVKDKHNYGGVKLYCTFKAYKLKYFLNLLSHMADQSMHFEMKDSLERCRS